MSDLRVPAVSLVGFTHAEVQAIAEDYGVDILHIKGAALDWELRRPWPEESDPVRTSIDADILIRPSHLATWEQALRDHGWQCLYDFADGSAFEHAATWTLEGLSSLDVHRYFPGIEGPAETAFDILWEQRQSVTITGILCATPSLTAQRLIVIIHAARGHSGRDDADRGRAWTSLTESEAADVEELAERLGARVALRAGTGRIESVRGERTYPLWKQLVDGNGSRLGLWWSRVASAPNLPAAIRVGVRMVLPNTRRMEAQLGRRPTPREVSGAYLSQLRYGARTVRKSLKRRSASRRKGRP